jgi:hypothetical protein
MAGGTRSSDYDEKGLEVGTRRTMVVKSGATLTMRHLPIRRPLQLLAVAFVLLLVAVTTEYAAWGAPDSTSSAVITFDDAAQAVHLTIPTPPCPDSQPQCQWKFFLNEPKLHVDVATVYGTVGVLSIDYPANFCGVIQADAYVGPPWVPKRGYQHTIADCVAATATSSTEPPSAGAASRR